MVEQQHLGTSPRRLAMPVLMREGNGANKDSSKEANSSNGASLSTNSAAAATAAAVAAGIQCLPSSLGNHPSFAAAMAAYGHHPNQHHSFMSQHAWSQIGAFWGN